MLENYLTQHIRTRGFTLGRPTHCRFSIDQKYIFFLRCDPRSPAQSLYAFDIKTKKAVRLLTPKQLLAHQSEELSAAERAERERMRLTVSGFASFLCSPHGKDLLLPYSGRIFVYSLKSARIREIRVEGPLSHVSYSPDGSAIAYLRQHNLYTYDLTTKREKAITVGGTEALSYGSAEFVAQEEMHRFAGYWWSPDSRALLVQESDSRQVEVWHLSDPSAPGSPAQHWYYPRPGKANVTVGLEIRSLNSKQRVSVRWDVKNFPYLVHANWHAKGGLTITVQSRDQRTLVLLSVSPKSGRTKALITERDSAWVPIDQQMPRWLRDGKHLLWSSAHGGGKELQLRTSSGELKRTLVRASEGYETLAHVDTKSNQIYFLGGTKPSETHLFRTSLMGGTPEKITKGELNVSALFSPRFADGGGAMITSTSLHDLPRTILVSPTFAKIAEIPSIASQSPLIPHVTIEEIRAGVRSYFSAIVRPRSFRRGEKFPVIVYVYGGPSRNVVQATQGSWFLLQWLAEQGFIVVAIDGRGTPRRGRRWEREIYQNFDTHPLTDQVSGLTALAKKYPEIDLKRVGITGWSFGGYMSALAVLKRPDVFHAAVAGAPVTDWYDYDTHYTERYLGVPPKTAAAYERASLLPLAPNLQRPLLLMHGTCDDNVFLSHTLKLIDALVKAGKPVEFLPLAGQTHMLPDPTLAKERWLRIAQFFTQKLMSETPRHIRPQSR